MSKKVIDRNSQFFAYNKYKYETERLAIKNATFIRWRHELAHAMPTLLLKKLQCLKSMYY